MSLYDTLVAVGANKPLKKKAVETRAPTQTPAKSTAFGPLPGKAFAPQQRQARQQVKRAERVLPKRPTPAIPYISNPTNKQVAASTTLAKRAGLLTPAGKQQLRQDPRQAQLLKTVQHYDRVGTRRVAEQLGRAVAEQLTRGAGSRLTRTDAIELGTQMTHQQMARDTVSPGRAHHKQGIGVPGLYLATIDTTKLSKDAAGFIDKHTSLNKGDLGPRGLVNNSLKDVFALGEAPFIGGYQVGRAGISAASGDLAPTGTLIKGIAAGVNQSALGRLALHGDVQGAGRAAYAHPLFTALDVSAGAGIVGRAAGAVARGAGSTVAAEGLRGALARAGSTVRPPVALTEDAGQAARGYVKQRTYSKDLTRKAAQVAADARREPLRDAKGRPVMISDRGRKVPVLAPRKAGGEIAGKPVLRPAEAQKLQHARADFQASQANSLERYARAEAEKSVGGLPKVKGEMAKNVASLITTGTVRSGRTLAADLVKRADQIKAMIATPGAYATKHDLQTAKTQEATLRRAASDPKVLAQATAIERLGLAQAKILNLGDAAKLAHRIHTAEAATRSRLSEYALAHMGATHHEVGGKAALRSPDGSYLSNADIMAHAKAHGRDPATLAYLPHVADSIGPRAFHKQFRPGTRPVAANHTRTGSLYLSGRNTFGHQLVHEELVNKATSVAKAKAIDKQIHEATMRHPAMEKARLGQTLTKHEQYVVSKGGYFTAKEADALAKKLAHDGQDYVAVRAHGAKLNAEDTKALQVGQNPVAMETAHQHLLSDRLVREGDGHRTNARNVVLMPQHEWNRLVKHVAPASEIEKAVQMLNAPFRMAVLPQPRWIAGNFIEPYLVRLPVKGAGINLPGLAVDVVAAKRYMKVLEKSTDPKLNDLAKAIRSQQLGGLLFGRRTASVHRTFESFNEGSRANRSLYVAHVVRNLPVTKQLGDLILAAPKAVFALNRILEPTTQWQALGKSIRNDVQAFSGSYLQSIATTKGMLEEVAKGSMSTATLHRWTKEQHDLLGKYEGFDPVTRRAIQSVAPFLPWSLAAARFVWWTMPLHSTGTEAFLLKASQVNQQQFADQHADVPPGGLSVAHVTGKGGLVDIARYTPFGFSVPLVKGDTSGLTDSLLPQISGVQAALSGKDPFGRDLKVKPTPGNPTGKPSGMDKLGIALWTGAEGTVPLLAIARRLREGGGTAFSNSTVLSPKTKPGSKHMSGVRRTLDPFRPTYLKPPGTGAGRAPKGVGSTTTQGQGFSGIVQGGQASPSPSTSPGQGFSGITGGGQAVPSSTPTQGLGFSGIRR